MGAGGSKNFTEEQRAKLLAFNAMQQKLEELEVQVERKDAALAIRQQKLPNQSESGSETNTQEEELREIAAKEAEIAAIKKEVSEQKEMIKNLPKGLDAERVQELANVSMWSLDTDVSAYNPNKEPEPEPEPSKPIPKVETKVDTLLASMPTPKNTSSHVADILSKSAGFVNHVEKVENQVRAINAFKTEFEQDLLASRSKMRNRIQKRKSRRKLKRKTSAKNKDGLQSSHSQSKQQEEAEQVEEEAPPPALPPRPKVSSVEFHKYTFVAGTLGINFEEMVEEPPFAMFVWSVVKGWQGDKQGVQADDVLVELNGNKLDHMTFDDVMDMLLQSHRPMTMKLRRDKYAKEATQIGAENELEKFVENNVKKEKQTTDNLPPPIPPKIPPRNKNKSNTVRGVESVEPS
tara:strand:+ start:415 stop:1629 length:1215 start_codon:yes stop_codon:yes gene_type:complete